MNGEKQMNRIDLCGRWSLIGGSGVRGAVFEYPAAQTHLPHYDYLVPGTVQEAMEAFTGDVRYAHNCLAARFIEEQLWHASRTFTVPEELIGRRMRLRFEGLDLVARVFVNGAEVGRHNNFYTPAAFDITERVHAGENTLSVVLESGLFYAGWKDVNGYADFQGVTTPLTRRVWLRKIQSSFEWDWSPRLLNVGIYKPCYIEVSEGIFADESRIFARLDEDLARGRVEITQFVTAQTPCAYSMTAEILETGETKTVEAQANPGVGSVSVTLPVDAPRLWYPRNYGEQALYTVRITLRCGQSVRVIEKKTGFRRVQILTPPHPDGGRYFILNINGVNVFAKGGNMVPIDLLASRFTREAYAVLLSRAEECNFNALRVWGGGLYETDDFYELCDERGILVWQDFVNACANYPAQDPEFFANYHEEIVHTIRRLSPHPALCIYTGNNEIDWQTGSMPPDAKRYPDAALYYWELPRALCAEGDDRYYQPSSPYSLPQDSCDPNDDRCGDQHPWQIGFTNRDYFGYRNMVCRFPNEGGILGPTSRANILSCLGEGQRFIKSFDWQLHDNSIADTTGANPDCYLTERLHRSIEGMSIEEYVYYGGFCQGEGLTEYILNFRRRMYSSASAIFWMYNDCWPAVRSWTVVDYAKNRTPSFHPVRRAFAPVAVDVVRDGDAFTVYAINDRLHARRARLEYGAFTPDGVYTRRETVEIEIPANASFAAARFTLSGCAEKREIPYAVLEAEGEPVARRRFVDVPYDQLGLEQTTITVRREGDYTLYCAPKPVLGVCVDLDGIRGEADGGPADNFFDLYPGMEYRVKNGGDVLYSYMG